MPLGSTVAFRPMRSATMFTELSIRPVKRACVHKIRTKFQVGSAIRKLGQGEDGETKTEASDGYVPLHPVRAGHFRAWQRQTPHARPADFVFPSLRAKAGRLLKNQSPLTALE